MACGWPTSAIPRRAMWCYCGTSNKSAPSLRTASTASRIKIDSRISDRVSLIERSTEKEVMVISTADAIVVIGVPVVDDECRAERRGAHGRVTTVGRRNGAMNDFGFDHGVGQRQRATDLPHIAAPD